MPRSRPLACRERRVDHRREATLRLADARATTRAGVPWPAHHRVQFGFVLGATDVSIARVATPPDADRRRVRRLAARRPAVSRRRRVAVLAVAALTALVALWRSGGPATVHHTPAASRARAVATQASPSPSVPARPGPSPGSLPQTRAYPSQTGALFKSLMAALWRGVDTGSPPPGATTVFPPAAHHTRN